MPPIFAWKRREPFGALLHPLAEFHEGFEHQMRWSFAGPLTDRSVRALFGSSLQQRCDALGAEYLHVVLSELKVSSKRYPMKMSSKKER